MSQSPAKSLIDNVDALIDRVDSVGAKIHTPKRPASAAARPARMEPSWSDILRASLGVKTAIHTSVFAVRLQSRVRGRQARQRVAADAERRTAATKRARSSPRVGDLANAFVLINTAAFLCAVIANNAGLVDWLSPSFNSEGFCVYGRGLQSRLLPHVPLQSHILCFFVDTGTAVILAWLAQRHRAMTGYSTVKAAAAGVLGHGIAHLALFLTSADAPLDQPAGYLADMAPAERLGRWAGLASFFFVLLRSAAGVPDAHAALWATLHGAVLTLLVPSRFGFTYVQTALLWVAAAYDMRRADKDFFYDLAAVVVHVPVGLVAWAEALGCESFFKQIGGHVWYDATIPLSLFTYYAIALANQPAPVRAKSA